MARYDVVIRGGLVVDGTGAGIDPRAESQIRQGVTTEAIGQFGISLAPCTPNHRRPPFGSLGSKEHGKRWDANFDLSIEAFAEEDNRLVLEHPLCSVESDTMRSQTTVRYRGG